MLDNVCAKERCLYANVCAKERCLYANVCAEGLKIFVYIVLFIVNIKNCKACILYKSVLRIHYILMRIRILDPPFKKMDPDPDPDADPDPDPDPGH